MVQPQTFYNQIAGGSLERLAALSDGLFAFGMTLLVLDLKVPEAATVHSEGQLAGGIALQLYYAIAPRLPWARD